MRILTVTHIYPSPLNSIAGPDNRDIVRGLAAQHPVAVIAPIPWMEELRAWRKGLYLPGDRRVVCDGIETVYPRYLFPPKVFRSWHGYFFRESVRTVFQRAVSEFRPNLVFAPWGYPDGWAAVDLGHQAGLPVVIRVRGSDVLLADPRRGRGRPTAEGLQRADAIVAVSRHLAERVIEFGAAPSRVHVIYNGIDPRAFHPGSQAEARTRLGLKEKEPLIIFIGNLIPLKGPDVLVEACARLARQGLSFSCCLIGQGSLRAWLAEEITRLGLGERVRLVGVLSHAQLPDWFRSADVVALPSHSEGIPAVLFEAAACGTPFVATRVGGIPEIADIGISQLVPPGNPAALATALAPFLTATPEQPNKPVAFRRSHADMVAELLSVFEQAIQRYSSADLPHVAAATTVWRPPTCEGVNRASTRQLNDSCDYPHPDIAETESANLPGGRAIARTPAGLEPGH
jgi:glycosyltransferase involved in cell wall biosynthesis